MEVCVFYPWQSKQPNKFKLLKNFTVNKKCPYDCLDISARFVCLTDLLFTRISLTGPEVEESALI